MPGAIGSTQDKSLGRACCSLSVLIASQARYRRQQFFVTLLQAFYFDIQVPLSVCGHGEVITTGLSGLQDR
jgi:hypothetical protein